ncbi:hypothetical protein [Acinetobacter venetianus]|uniref:hypothetical protein n=1 Tax=Acinetobacter venetianus TaxID=52133 RepID=UPI002AC11FE3|nr:hypothetical protein [Acinetobacter venetianus]
MRYFYIKKGNLYLHIQTTTHEEYQDYSDIDAIKFLEKREVDRFLVTRGRKLKGVEIKRE